MAGLVGVRVRIDGEVQEVEGALSRGSCSAKDLIGIFRAPYLGAPFIISWYVIV